MFFTSEHSQGHWVLYENSGGVTYSWCRFQPFLHTLQTPTPGMRRMHLAPGQGHFWGSPDTPCMPYMPPFSPRNPPNLPEIWRPPLALSARGAQDRSGLRLGLQWGGMGREGWTAELNTRRLGRVSELSPRSWRSRIGAKMVERINQWWMSIQVGVFSTTRRKYIQGHGINQWIRLG